MKFLVPIFSLVLAISSNSAYADQCTESDRKNIAYFGSDYDPELAYEFGKKIQAALISNDSQQLVDMFVGGSWIDKNLIDTILSKSIKETFTKAELEAVLTATPSCSPFNSYGYMLGPGTIWYAYTREGAFSITAVNISLTD